MPKPHHLTRIRVRYAETDQMGIVHHTRYVEWLETARVEFLRDAGFVYKELEERGVLTSVISLAVRYRAPARFDEVIEVRTRLVELKRLKLGFAYTIHREDGALLAEAETMLGSVSREGRPLALPPDLVAGLSAWKSERHSTSRPFA